MLNTIARERGMTLLEVMVGVAVAALLLAMGMPSFVTGMQNRQIRTAAQAIETGLAVARTEALRRNRTVKFHLRDGNGWTVGCDPVDATLGTDGEPNCPDRLQVREAAEGSTNAQINPVQLGGTTAFVGDIKFSALGRTTADTLPGGAVAEYQVTNPVGGTCATAGGEMRCLSVRVTAAGQIRMCDPAVAAGDPRAC
jgi:type IV fimbrial biogenesis protein FimT